MRISSSVFYASSVNGMMDQQSAISRLSQQLTTGNKLLSAADDPVATSQVMTLNDQVAQSTQYATNLQNVSQIQSEESTVLSQLQTDLASAQKVLTGLGGTQNSTTNASAATMLNGLYKDITSLANYQDSNGNYIFAGLLKGTAPYSQTSVYNGTPPQTSGATTAAAGISGTRQIQIANGQSIQANDDLSQVMQAGTPQDLLQALDQAAYDLKNNTANVQTSSTAAYSTVSTALGNLRNLQASLAARQQQVKNQQTFNQQLVNNNQDTLSNLTQVDQAAAIVELQQRQTSLQAAESAFSQISKLSVFNYL